MATHVPSAYHLDDWEKIDEIYTKFVEEHKQQIDNLEEWVKKEPHLPDLSRPSLGFFLVLTGNLSTESAKEMIDSYFTHKTRNPGMFKERFASSKAVEQQLDLAEIATPDPWKINLKGGRLTFLRLSDSADPSKLDFSLAMKSFTAGLDFELGRVAHYVNGVVTVIDMEGFHLGYLPKININDVGQVLKYIQIMENLIREVHVINCNGLLSQIILIVRPFLSKALVSKIFSYMPNEMEALYNKIPKSCVPSTYGGDLPSMSVLNGEFRKRFQSSDDWLKLVDSEEYRVKEELRRVKAGQEEMNGSFRTLCID